MAKNIESQINALFKVLKNFEPSTQPLAISPLTSVSPTAPTNDSSTSPVLSETPVPLATQVVPINTKSVAEQIKAVFERIKTYKPQPKKEEDSQLNSTPSVATNITSPLVATNTSSSPKTTKVIEQIKAVFNRIKTYKPKETDGVGQGEGDGEREEESSLILEALPVANAVISSSLSSTSRQSLQKVEKKSQSSQRSPLLRSSTAPGKLGSQDSQTTSTLQKPQIQNSQMLTNKQQKPETSGVVTTLTNQSDPSKEYTNEYKF